MPGPAEHSGETVGVSLFVIFCNFYLFFKILAVLDQCSAVWSMLRCAGSVSRCAGSVLRCIGSVLGLCFGVLGLSRGVLGLCCGVLGLCCGVLGLSFSVLGLCCGVLGFSFCGSRASCCGAWPQGLSSCLHRLCCPAACGLLVPQPRITPMFPALEGRFLTTGHPERSPEDIF